MLARLEDTLRRLYAVPLVETGLIFINLVGFAAGALLWYGPQLAVTPVVLWPWLVDSPLSVLGFALALPLLKRGRPGTGWLATWALLANVKYGLWTVLYWSLWWRAGNPLTLESGTMTFTHAAMVVMGLSLLVYFRPRVREVLASAAWFGFNDYLDYWQNLAPRVPTDVPLSILRAEQVVVTVVLTLFLLALTRPTRVTGATTPARPVQRGLKG
jgi:uncharacterized membrane protein YpjA